MSQMTDAEVKQAIERHGLAVAPRAHWISWVVTKWNKNATIYATAEQPTLTEAVAEVVRQIEETQK